MNAGGKEESMEETMNGVQTAETAGAPESAGAENSTQTQNSTPTFDDMLKNGFQGEFDRRVNKAIATALANKQNDLVTEAQKLARMTAEQKAEHERKQREEQLAKREAEITRRELTAQAKDTLAGKGLPIELAATLNYTDADACSASLAAVEKAFAAAVSKAVDERLRQPAPKSGAENQPLSGVEAAFYGLNPTLKK